MVGGLWVERRPRQSPVPRAGHQIAFDPRGRMILFGGGDGAQTFGDTWEWDGSEWRELGPRLSPPARSAHAMCTETRRGVVLFGGAEGTALFDDTWIWDGENWAELEVTGRPSARALHSLVPGPTGELVMFGGIHTAPSDETWVLSGATWTLVPSSPRPEARFGHACAVDATTNLIVMFGGMTQARAASDTWVFDGLTWNRAHPGTDPAARRDHALAGGSGGVLLFGGDLTAGVEAVSGASDETWLWRQWSWLRSDSPETPPARRSHAMAFDEERQRSVLFGGVDGRGTRLQDAWGTRRSAVDEDIRGWTVATPWSCTRLRRIAPQGHAVRRSHGQRTCQRHVAVGRPCVDAGLHHGRAARALSGHGLAQHQTTGTVVLFGGLGISEELGDTWVLNGTQWRSPLQRSRPRRAHGTGWPPGSMAATSC